MVDASGTTTFGYTAAGQLQSAGGLWSSDTVTYGYSQQLRQTLTLAQPSGGNWQQTYGFDGAWRLQTLSSPAGSFGYAIQLRAPRSSNHHASQLRLDHQPLRLPRPSGLYRLGQLLGPRAGRLLLRHGPARPAHQHHAQPRPDHQHRGVGYDNIGQITSWSAREVWRRAASERAVQLRV